MRKTTDRRGRHARGHDSGGDEDEPDYTTHNDDDVQ